MAKIVAVFNQKGGVGKTTTNINLTAALSLEGYRVLVLDIDPQGNTTSGFGIDKYNMKKSIYNGIIQGENFEELIISTAYENLHIIPSHPDLAGAEVELSDSPQREMRLKNSIQNMLPFYDYVFVDCPPSLGLLTINALAMATSILVPIQCEFYALEGLSQLISTINLVKKALNPTLEIEGVLITMYDKRTNLSNQVLDEIVGYFKDKVFNSIIPRNVKLAEAPSYGKTIFEYANDSRGARAYQTLAKEFIQRQGGNR